MKKQILIVAASLALLSGCGGRGSVTGASRSASAGAATSTNVAAVPVPAMPPPGGADEGMEPAAAAPDLVTGEKVYKSTCSICHKSGLKGAPRLGIKEDWEARLTQSNEILYEHAVKGFRGKKGIMPSRGSNAKLTDAEVRAAVDYMVVHAIPSWSFGN
ncbi:MAG: cytochrome c5 family protein [Nitrosomonadales bacterium]|nr:cytochrome c5 family protein [Nitrosomonadales bacterium]